MAAPDRVASMLAQDRVTGIDFVYVHASQTVIDVFFIRDPQTLADSMTDENLAPKIRIWSPSGGETLPVVPVVSADWQVVDGRKALRVTTASPGDFSRYRLRIDDARLDRYFNDVPFTFKANCRSELDCKPRGPECPAEPRNDFPVNYLARDFWSFRQALLDFATERYPDWKDRLEADAGMMLAEAMSALGDEMAFYQDRVAREAYLETAVERRSLRRHARLVDYDVHDGLSATAWLDFTVRTGESGTIPKGAAVSDPDGGVVFETGAGLFDTRAGFAVSAARNSLSPHLWDEDDICLQRGKTELHIEGHHKADLPFDDFTGTPGKWVLLKTNPIDPSVPARNLMVKVVAVDEMQDLVLNVPVTRLQWEQGTPFGLDLTVLEVRGNLVPATAGRTFTRQFRIGAGTGLPEAVERAGPGTSIANLFSLPEAEPETPDYAGDLVRLGTDPHQARPEIQMFEARRVGNTWMLGDEWEWRRSLVGVNSSQSNDRHFTLDDGTWRRVAGYQRIGTEIVHVDYANSRGLTIRFGDGEFGMQPANGKIFHVRYRLGNGLAGNVPAGTLTKFEASFVESVTNPLPASGGMAPETAAQVKQLAPEAFRAVTYRAVRPEDYAEAAERLAWVDRAGSAFRWTGSWLSCFTTPDPRGAIGMTRDQRAGIEEQLDRFRQAGREAWVQDPVYANLDLEIYVCVEPHCYRGDVKERVQKALLGRAAFFSPDNFTFGTPLERSALEAAIQSVEGVRAIRRVRLRRRGRFDWRVLTEYTFRVAPNEVIRVENSTELPERGSLKLVMVGGA